MRFFNKSNDALNANVNIIKYIVRGCYWEIFLTNIKKIYQFKKNVFDF